MTEPGVASHLGQAFAEYGRIAKTLHLLSFVDLDDHYRRQASRQLTIQEGRHQLADKDLPRPARRGPPGLPGGPGGP